MIRRVLMVATWLLAGHAVLFGLYWGLLEVPESSVPMLIVSALLAGTIAVGASGLYAGAVLAWDPLRPAGRALAAGFRRFYWIVPAALLFAAATWIVAGLRAWHANARGAIDATLMLQSGWADTSLLHIAIDGVLVALQWVVGLSLALGALAAGVSGGARGVGSPQWLKRSLDPRTLLLVAAIEVILVILPWHHVYWRPRELPVGAEPAFVMVKLGIMACLAALAGALTAWTITRALRGWPRASFPWRD